MSRTDTLEVFFSYSHRDQELRDKLETHLALLKRQDVIKTWYDGRITAGQELEPEIFARLESAHVILLLISPDFIASDFCWTREMKRALERHEAGEARVIPVILRPTDNWHSAPIGKLKALPKDGLAATEWPDLDRAFRDVAAGIRLAVEDMTSRRASMPASGKPLRVVLLIGHSVADPLPDAPDMARLAVQDFQSSGLAVELRVDQATTASFEREAEEGCDLFLYYGHGTEAGELSLADGRKSFSDLSGPSLQDFWRGLKAAFIFACYGDRFARQLPCPWVAFSEPILTRAPKGFVHALLSVWPAGDLASAVEKARTLCAREMKSDFTAVMRFSPQPLPALRPPTGFAHRRRVSPALAGSYRVDFGSLRADDHLYPDHDPFVGRAQDLESLLRLPLPYDDQPLQRVVWVHGDAGMGKSALLRQFAAFVRDMAFRDQEERVHLLHLYCYRHTRPEQVVEALCSRAAELYDLKPQPSSLEELFSALERRFGARGTHVWVLDDLTYLSVQPDRMEEAVRLVSDLRALANSHGLRWELVISSRRPGPPPFETLAVGALSPSEALVLANRIRSMPFSLEGQLGAARLFQLVRTTDQYKRALLLAVEGGMGYGEYAEALSQDGLHATEHLDETKRKLRFEVSRLAELESRHGFAYRRFLDVYHPLIARAAYFTRAELEDWFGSHLVADGARSQPQAYNDGLTYLARLGFVFLERRDGNQVFSMPPNQRWSMRSLSDPCGGAALPPGIPLRGARERLSLALEGVQRGSLEAVGDLLMMASDYSNDLEDPACAAAVFASMLARAELVQPDRNAELRILGEIVSRYDAVHSSYPSDEVEASEQVAKALFNKGVSLGSLGRSDEAIAVYSEVESRYGSRPEAGLAEQVAKALFNKGVSLGSLGRSDEEIAVYSEVESRYGSRPEAGLAEQVAKALVNKGVSLRSLGRTDEAIAVYSEVESRYASRPEAGLAEQVAKALGNKGWSEYMLGLYDASIASSHAALERRPGETWIRCNLGLALLHVGKVEAAKEAYSVALTEMSTRKDLERMALQDLHEALARQPDLPGAREIRDILDAAFPPLS